MPKRVTLAQMLLRERERERERNPGDSLNCAVLVEPEDYQKAFEQSQRIGPLGVRMMVFMNADLFARWNLIFARLEESRRLPD